MPILKYPLWPDIYLNPDGKTVRHIIDRPKIPIQIGYRKKIHPISAPALALVDSGADNNVFPAQWGDSLGIKVVSLPSCFTGAVGDNKVKVYRCEKIKLYIYGKSLKQPLQFETEADFCYEQKFPLLGRSGFFNFFKAIRFIKNVEIELEF